MLFPAIKFSSGQDPGPWSQDTLALPRCRVARNETLDALWAAKTQTAERRMANCTPLCCRKSGNRQNHLLRRFASNNRVVQFRICACRAGPGKILLHAIGDDFRPESQVSIGFEGP